MSEKTRVIGQQIKLDGGSLKDFFNNRGAKYEPDQPYISVLYQDKTPEIAVQRDMYEKKLITPQLTIHPQTRVLDLGCGVGRWADALLCDVASYTGVDFSDTLIDQANQRFEGQEKAKFKVLPAQNVTKSTLDGEDGFDLVLSVGLLIYMNDDEVVRCFENLRSITAAQTQYYLREPLGVESRLTLNQHWSEDMNQEYSAIYRTGDELTELISAGLGTRDIGDFVPLYDDPKLNNRSETKQYYSVFTVNT